MARVYFGDFGDTICRVVTCATCPPEEDGTRRLPITFLEERIPVVGRVGVRALAPILRLRMGDLLRDGDDRAEGEAGRPLPGWPA